MQVKPPRLISFHYAVVLPLAAAAIVALGGFALELHLLTSPPAQPEKPQPNMLAEASASYSGDPHNQLTPIFPAAPGGNLPDTAATSKPATTSDSASASQSKPDETSGSAPVEEHEQTAVTTQQPHATPVKADASPKANAAAEIRTPGACNVDACSAAYRSFRASDCTYQPYEGPRKFCDAGEAGATQASASPPPRRVDNPASQDRRDLEATIRTTRDLPPDAEARDGRPVVVIEPPDGPRQRWILEPR